MAVELSPEILVAARARDQRAKELIGLWMTNKLVRLYQAQGRRPDVVWELSQQTILEVFQKLDKIPVEPEDFREFVGSSP